MMEYINNNGSIGFIEDYDAPNMLVRRTSNGRIDLVERRFIATNSLVRYSKKKIYMPELMEDVKKNAQMDIFNYDAIMRRKQRMEEEDKEFEERYADYAEESANAA